MSKFIKRSSKRVMRRWLVREEGIFSHTNAVYEARAFVQRESAACERRAVNGTSRGESARREAVRLTLNARERSSCARDHSVHVERAAGPGPPKYVARAYTGEPCHLHQMSRDVCRRG